MIPYADFLYFGVLLYIVVPTVVLGLAGYGGWRWILLTTITMLMVQYGGSMSVAPGTATRELWLVGGYAVFEWAVAFGFLRLRLRAKRRWLFYTTLLLTLLPLLLAKYAPLGALTSYFGFLGISYVTFRSLDVIFCIQDGLITSLPVRQFFAYLFFFATISAGPIDRYRRFDADWKHRRTRAEFLEDLDEAVRRVFKGLFYKFIVAALVKRFWLDPVTAQSGFGSTISYMYAYSMYLFFDFAGYSAFAIGFSYLMGIHTPENFDRPFLARNIRDFWNRWHITLSWWIRDHVYMRFVMAAIKGRWFRSKYLASYLGLFLAFGLMGLWHGTGLSSVLYGLYHGALLSTYEAFTRWNKQRKWWGDGPVWNAAAVVGTFNCVCFGFLIFSGRLTSDGGNQLMLASGPAYEGRYEKASCDEIGGWAWDANNPQTPVDVDVYVDGTLRATVRADLVRQDLADAGKGNGAHAFLHPISADWKDGRSHTLTVKISGTQFELSDSPKSIICVLSAQSMDGLEGTHDASDCDLISGWAWDATAPDRAVDVDIYEGTKLLATVTADRFRESLRDLGYGNGKHGFLWLTPAQLRDGRPHTISVRIAGTNLALRHTPQVIQCSEPAARVPVAPSPTPTGHAAVAGAPTQPPEGPPPSGSYTDNGDGAISDLHTGLMWEKKVRLDGMPDAANLHDADNCYPWAGTCAEGNAECRVDADCGDKGPCNADDCQAAPGGLTIFKWAEQLNKAKFAGHNDWRMPTSKELYTIVTPWQKQDPATTATFHGTLCGAACGDLNDLKCSCTNSGIYWAATARAPNPDDPWMMLFYCRGNLFLDLKNNRFYVRAVRGG